MKKFFNTKEGKTVVISLIVFILALLAIVIFNNNFYVVVVAIPTILISALFSGTSANDYNANK